MDAKKEFYTFYRLLRAMYRSTEIDIRYKIVEYIATPIDIIQNAALAFNNRERIL